MSKTAPTLPYVNDALRWVAAEVRFPVLEELSVPGPPVSFQEALRDLFPVHEENTELGFTVGVAGPSAQQVVRHRFVARDRLMSVTVSRENIVLEVTAYSGWTEFRGTFERALRALADSREPDGILRVGLRYVDEIRVSEEITDLRDWVDWLSPTLTSPITIDPQSSPSSATLALQYGTAPGFVTLFRAAPFPEGRTVQAEGPLRTPFDTPAGPYFLLDTDSSWADPHRQVPVFDVDAIVEVANELHEPCHRLFEAAITDRLRDEVLRRPREEVWSIDT